MQPCIVCMLCFSANSEALSREWSDCKDGQQTRCSRVAVRNGCLVCRRTRRRSCATPAPETEATPVIETTPIPANQQEGTAEQEPQTTTTQDVETDGTTGKYNSIIRIANFPPFSWKQSLATPKCLKVLFFHWLSPMGHHQVTCMHFYLNLTLKSA